MVTIDKRRRGLKIRASRSTGTALLFLAAIAALIPIGQIGSFYFYHQEFPDTRIVSVGSSRVESDGSFIQWSRRGATYNQTEYSPSEMVMTCVVHSARSSVSYKDLKGSVVDILKSPRAFALVYTASQPFLERLRLEFRDVIFKGQMVVQLAEAMNVDALGPDLVHDMTYAHAMAFAAQHAHRAYYTLMLEAGMRLHTPLANFTNHAIEHYQSLAANYRVCLSTLSAAAHPGSSIKEMPVILVETAEHAGRMSLLLRSALPYRVLRAREILKPYCTWFLWALKEVEGPRLFEMRPSKTPSLSTSAPSLSNATPPFLNASMFQSPPWIDPNFPVGPVVWDDKEDQYQIVFGAPTMRRPNNVTEYLEMFMSELIAIVETDFVRSKGTKTAATAYNALILLLVCGNTLESMATHRQFLEDKYQNAIDRGIVRLVDTPFESYPLDKIRLTFVGETPERRYWRSKHNLDLASTLQAMSGLGDYVMLLEDDTGFQPGFGNHLKYYLTTSSQEGEQPYGIPRWSVTDYGFGYSGVLLHSSDALVYSRLHWTLFDEKPCDLFAFYLLVRKAVKVYAKNAIAFSNGKTMFFKHYGKVSSLAGKTQDVWV